GVNDKSLGLHNRHVDWLRSERFGSTLSRTMDHDNAFAPYGENYAGAGARDLDFTGQDQDTVSGMYDFLYREYSPGQGRWISPDPAGLGAVNPANPQSWNRYAYVADNPLNAVDSLGLLGKCGGGDQICPLELHRNDGGIIGSWGEDSLAQEEAAFLG